MTMLRETIANRLRELRGDKLQGVVAHDVGISQATLSNYERAKREQSLAVLIPLVRYYGVPLSALVTERDEPG